MASLLPRFLSVAFVVALLAPAAAFAAPEAKLWPKWQAHDDVSTATIDHSTWDRFLHAYAHPNSDGIVRVAYGQVTPADKAALAADLAKMSAVPISRYNYNEQRAYWIDLYNELTVKFVLDHYPMPSINDGSAITKLFSTSPWARKLIKVEGEELTLDDIEHRILRPIWRDPRIHYALNCASMGCPNLQPMAYTAANTEQLLDTGARQYINSPRGVTVRDGKLIVSSIYVWYQADFGGTDAGVIDHLKHYANPDLLRQLGTVDHISQNHYDWALNEQPAQ
jgi:hypothetical protein